MSIVISSSADEVMAKICLVSCVSSKRSERSLAKDLYTSPLFKKSKEFAVQHFDRWFVLSAQHHLVDPEEYIDPYEKTLNRMSARERAEWAEKVFEQLVQKTSPDDDITFLAGEKYREKLNKMLQSRGNKVFIPMKGMSIGRQLHWLSQQKFRHTDQQAFNAFYSILLQLEEQLGGTRLLGECTGKQVWPERGVYFLFEPGEFRGNDTAKNRIVRVGTHMVSRGSKATLWNRLRTHRGHANGTGNHRASVFRRHVGEAIIQREGVRLRVQSWGQWQSASRGIISTESDLERQVSEYIGSMSVVWLDVPDDPGPQSDRAFLERNAVALLSKEGRKVDPPSPGWLGRYSPTEAITKSGLWNVNFVDYPYDDRFLDVFAAYVEITTQKRSKPTKSIAPRDWYLADKGKAERGQLFLFEEE